jgi:hypothetical protein
MRGVMSSSSPCATPLPDGSVLLGGLCALAPAPRIIWAFWKEHGQLPDVVQASILTWQRFHPDFRIEVVTPASLRTFVDLDLDALKWLDGPTRESDVVRMHLLAKYGGVWLDASCLLAAPLHFFQDVFSPVGREFAGFFLEKFTTHPCYPVVENWAFAARPGSPFMQAWLHKFMSIPNKPGGVGEALDTLQRTGTVDTQAIDSLHYLFMHVCAQAVMQSGMPLSMHLYSAARGPYKYMYDSNEDTAASVRRIMRTFHPRKPSPPYPFYKLRGRERGAMTPAMQARILKRAQSALYDS